MAHQHGIHTLASGLRYQARQPVQTEALKPGLVDRFLRWAGLKVDTATLKNRAGDKFVHQPFNITSERGLTKLQVGAKTTGISNETAFAILDSAEKFIVK